MATEIKETLLGDIRKLIHDAWEFFAPPLIKLGIALALFWYVCGVGPLVRLASFVGRQTAAFPATDIQGFLERYNLTALMPLAALFIVSVLAYSVNRIIFGVAALLPFNFTTFGARMERLAVGDPMFRQYWAAEDAWRIGSLIEGALAKVRDGKHESLLSNIDGRRKEAGRVQGLFAFAQFLVVWTVACAVLSVTVEGAVPFTFARVFLLLSAVLVFGVYSACKLAGADEQLTYAEFHAARAVLADEGLAPPLAPPGPLLGAEEADEVEAARAHERRARDFHKERWWFVGTGLMDWWRMLRFYRYDDDYLRYVGRPPLRVLLEQGTNLVWFVAGALLILILSRFLWWAAAALFVGYVSVTVIDCLLVTATLAAAGWHFAAARLRRFLPPELLRDDDTPPGPPRPAELREDAEQPPDSLQADINRAKSYALGTAAVRVTEAAVATLMSIQLAKILF